MRDAIKFQNWEFLQEHFKDEERHWIREKCKAEEADSKKGKRSTFRSIIYALVPFQFLAIRQTFTAKETGLAPGRVCQAYTTL